MSTNTYTATDTATGPTTTATPAVSDLAATAAPSGTTQKVPNYDLIKTHFPAARIKKLMQSDEDIGKVAQATPVVVGKALEIFLCSLVEKSCDEARKNGARRISAQHVKTAVEVNEKFDFLVEVVAKYANESEQH